MTVLSPRRPLAQCLEQLGPQATPSGTVRWSREFPMGTEILAFSAELEREDDQLVARVRESHMDGAASPTKDIFLARWVAHQGAWRFKDAALDGKGVAEQSAIATFQDYLDALGAEPSGPAESTQTRKRATP